MNEDPTKFNFFKYITDQISAISYIHHNSNLNLWASASIDGEIYLYTAPLCKLIRCIRIPTKSCEYVFLLSSPLPSIIIISVENEKSYIYLYSINGKFLVKIEEDDYLSSPIIIKVLNSYEYLAYILHNKIIFRDIQNLSLINSIDNIPNVYAIFYNGVNKILTFDKTGNDIHVLKDN